MEPDYGTAMLIGLAAGLLVAMGGAVKDAPYEGFKPLTFWRSPIVAAIEAPILAVAFDWPNPFLLALATIATERATVEGYKIQRSQMPSKFLVGEWGIAKPTIVEVPFQVVDSRRADA